MLRASLTLLGNTNFFQLVEGRPVCAQQPVASSLPARGHDVLSVLTGVCPPSTQLGFQIQGGSGAGTYMQEMAGSNPLKTWP